MQVHHQRVCCSQSKRRSLLTSRPQLRLHHRHLAAPHRTALCICEYVTLSVLRAVVSQPDACSFSSYHLAHLGRLVRPHQDTVPVRARRPHLLSRRLRDQHLRRADRREILRDLPHRRRLVRWLPRRRRLVRASLLHPRLTRAVILITMQAGKQPRGALQARRGHGAAHRHRELRGRDREQHLPHPGRPALYPRTYVLSVSFLP